MGIKDSGSTQEFIRILIKLGIGLVGLVLIRLIVQNLPVVREAGAIMPGKMTAVAGATMIIDALLLSVLVMFALEARSHLRVQFSETPGLATMVLDLVFLITAGLAYTGFKPICRAWPSVKQTYTWTFLVLVAIPVVQMIVLLYRDRDGIAAMFVDKIMSRRASEAEASRT